jgi:hypothetical protein
MGVGHRTFRAISWWVSDDLMLLFLWWVHDGLMDFNGGLMDLN